MTLGSTCQPNYYPETDRGPPRYNPRTLWKASEATHCCFTQLNPFAHQSVSCHPRPRYWTMSSSGVTTRISGREEGDFCSITSLSGMQDVARRCHIQPFSLGFAFHWYKAYPCPLKFELQWIFGYYSNTVSRKADGLGNHPKTWHATYLPPFSWKNYEFDATRVYQMPLPPSATHTRHTAPKFCKALTDHKPCLII